MSIEIIKYYGVILNKEKFNFLTEEEFFKMYNEFKICENNYENEIFIEINIGEKEKIIVGIRNTYNILGSTDTGVIELFDDENISYINFNWIPKIRAFLEGLGVKNDIVSRWHIVSKGN